MSGFTGLEEAALRAIFAETPELADVLAAQLRSAVVRERENSGCGFFTTITVSDDAPRADCPRVLGHSVHAQVPGLNHGLGFVLFMAAGRLDMLEAYAVGPESTITLDLENMPFTIEAPSPGR